ncbi:hypothetical protein N7510_005214 [Penicillium lagena]|uniref:uncharacterized protein n=1 Tax=Penicillium lagena TaxID=94218 RepID=UPI002541CC2F|nr:uncharacterized protein N7510_005214 [Penicillium lagena]KAJ5612020.1 hypothetical protein N7510_005214 [Penicillium lagena]
MEQAGKRIMAKIVDDAAATDPDRKFAIIPNGPELSDGLQTVTMKQASNATNFFCNWIEKTIGPAQNRETLTYMAANDVRYWFFILACQKLGYQAFFPSIRNSNEAHAHLLKVVGVTKFFTSAERRGRALEIQSFTPGIEVFEVPFLKTMLNAEGDFGSYPFPKTFAEAEDDTVLIIHSSGTTGMPKPVHLTNGFIGTWDAISRMEWPAGGEPAIFFQLGQKDLILTITPFFHIMGMLGLFFTVFHGTTALLGPEKPLSVTLLTELMKMGKPKTGVFPPSVLEDMIKNDKAVACIKQMRAIYFGGAPLALETGERLRKYTKMVPIIGSSEAGWLQAIVPENPDDWHYFKWHPQSGIDMQQVGESLYEAVFKRQENRDFTGIFHTFPKVDTYRTKDLFTPHPTNPGLWKFYGRGDDVIVLSNGEKFNPVTMETMIESHPLVSRAVVVGQSRFQAALLIEPRPDMPEMDVKAFTDEIWPSVQAANQTIAQHGRVMKNHIGLGSKNKPFKRTPKGSTQRQATIREYEKEIDAIYVAGLKEELEHQLPETLDQATVGDYLRQMIARVLEKSEISVDQNFYTAGLDSLMTIQISRMLQKGIQMRWPDVKAALLTPQTIYGNPTVEQLSRVVCEILEGKARQTNINRQEKIKGLIDKYTADLPVRDQNFPQNTTNAPSTVILTGSTGSLGTYLLNSLLVNKSVTKIYCLNRSDAEQRQKKGLEEKGLHVDENGWKKLDFLQVTFGDPRFGLDEAKYQELLESVDTIIHNAWKVDFNHTVDSFEDTHIRGVRRFVDFSIHSKHNAHLHFVSSISAVGAWTSAMGSSVPEVPMEDYAVALAQGYGESKHVGERICLEASRRSRVATTIYRVGQIAGPTSPSGQWNPHEWLPTIIATSKALGKVPNRLGSMAIDWIPVDTLSSIIMELVNTRHANRSLDLCSAFHVTNPSTAPWSSLIPAIHEKYTLELVELAEWVGELEKIEKPTPADVAQKPGLKLLDFYKSLLSENSLVVALEVKRTQEASAMMRTLGPISLKEIEELEVQLTEIRKRVRGLEHPNTLTGIVNPAAVCQNQGRLKEVEGLAMQIVEIRKRVSGPEHPGTLVSIGNLALVYQNQGRWKEAEELEVQVVEIRKRVLGPEHPDTLLSITNLAVVYQNQGRWKEAEELEVQVLETRKRVLGPEHPDTLISMANLALARDDVEADSKDVDDQTPLSWTADSGNEAVVKLLLGGAREAHEEVVELLLERDAVKADTKGNDDLTPLA